MLRGLHGALALVCIINLSQSTDALADGVDCSTVDLSSGFPSVMGKAARFQAPSNQTCHSMAAADMISYEFKTAVSSQGIAADYFPHAPAILKTALEVMGIEVSERSFAGTIYGSLQSAITNGVCAEATFPEDYNNNNESFKNVATAIEVCRQRRLYQSDEGGYPELATSQIKTVHVTKGNGLYATANSTSVLDEWLDRRRPVGMNFDVGPMIDPSRLSGLSSFFKMAPHVAIIVGREQIDGICHYKIRNSWGEKCRTPNGVSLYRNDLKCDDRGHLWITRNELVTRFYKGAVIDR